MRYLLNSLLLLALSSSLQLTQASSLWEVDAQASQLQFIALVEGEEIKGEFSKFQSTLLFETEDLENSQFDVEIHTTSLNSRNRDRDDTLRSSDFFGITQWPTARFITQHIKQTGPEQYQANATLTIRDITLALPFYFNLRIVEENGQRVFYATGHAELNRLNYDLGRGDWADTEVIAAKVKVVAKIRAIAIAEN